MKVFVVASNQGVEVYEEEWRADIVHAEWLNDTGRTGVKRATCEVIEKDT